MSYEVDSRAEAKERLKEFGTDSVAEIRHAHGSHHHRIRPALDAQQLTLQANAAPGQLAADYAALTTALGEIKGQVAAVEALMIEAARLAQERMMDGHGPIAHAMKAAFRHCAADEEGAVRALTSYRDELQNLALAIEKTRTLYQQIDSDLVQHLNTAGGQHV